MAGQPNRVLDVPAPRRCPGCGGATRAGERRAMADRAAGASAGDDVAQGARATLSLLRPAPPGAPPEQSRPPAPSWRRAPRSAPGMAWGAWLHHGLGLSFPKCSAVLGRLGIDVSAGAICSSAASCGTDLAPHPQAILAHVASAPAVTMDETGWRVGGERAESCPRSRWPECATQSRRSRLPKSESRGVGLIRGAGGRTWALSGKPRGVLYASKTYSTSAEAFRSEIYVAAGQRHSAERLSLIRGAL